ncbi:WD40-repeat-containing domain protein [Cladochytrium replicatum]|nr:WD40-repeat-containing domain protein [Cladochytrium replicatum]
MLHSMDVEWPCLSFEILRDNLGADRKHFPHTTYIVAGTQAERRKDNKIYVMKVSQLHRTKTDDDDEEDDNDEDLDEDPILEHKAIAHDGGINRIRAMHLTEKHIVATWAETNKVHIWDITLHVSSLDSTTPPPSTRPLFSIDRHKDEGFALDWSPVHAGKVLTGGNDKQIFFTQANSAGTFTTDAQPFTGHKGSVEDIQWSPYGEDTFVSASSDQTIRVWDLRQSRKKGPMLTVKAHDSDVNVLSWNRTNQQLLASGSDSGVFSIWDLRVLASAKDPTQIAPAASFEWHTKPITSIEWAPHDVSVLAVSGADDQLTLWDLSLERDAEEQGTMLTGADDVEVKVPAQLLFIHQGQKQIKEAHWHRQIPGMLVSTAETGFNLFKTINS